MTTTQNTENKTRIAIRPDQKRALSDLRCASRKLAELFRDNDQETAAETLENFVIGLVEQVDVLKGVA